MKKQKQKRWFISFLILALIVIITHYLPDFEVFSSLKNYINVLKKLSTSVFMVLIILFLKKIVEKLVIPQAQTEGDQYNLRRITKLLTILFILIVVASFLFQNLYAVAVSFGVISIILGFALQAPITSFIAWLYIVFRRPYQVGNRIQVNGLRGDVMEISYLDTIIWECHGAYLGNDQRSGRVIHFPNSLILKDQIINYSSGPHAPFIWNETALQVAFSSDLQFVEECMLAATKRDFSEHYPNIQGKRLETLTPIVYFRDSHRAWLEAVISYPVEPDDTTGRRNRILRYMLPLLNEEKDRVKFPEAGK